MAYRIIPFITKRVYHVYNRGVEKREIFTCTREYRHFLDTTIYYQQSNPPTRFSLTPRGYKSKKSHLVSIIAYCFMPNHFHLILQQLQDDGISSFVSKITNSYTRYFNSRHKRTGHLFQGTFKAKAVKTDEQLLHLSRYIHLNPYVSNLSKKLSSYSWSSYPEYVGIIKNNICEKSTIFSHFKNRKNYEKFVNDYAGYAKSLEALKRTAIDY